MVEELKLVEKLGGTAHKAPLMPADDNKINDFKNLRDCFPAEWKSTSTPFEVCHYYLWTVSHSLDDSLDNNQVVFRLDGL